MIHTDKKGLLIFIFSACVLMFFAVSVASVYAEATSSTGLVPSCKDVPNPAGKTGVFASHICTPCDIFALIQNVLNFLWWKISIPIATLMLIYSGLLLMNPLDASGKSRQTAKKVLTNTILGIFIVFFAWLLIDTIIKVISGQSVERSGSSTALVPQLREGKIQFGPWNKIECPVPELPPPPLPPVQPVVVSGNLRLLNNAHILVKPGANVNGTRPQTISEILQLKNVCDANLQQRSGIGTCDIVVTSGTESVHGTGVKSHANGYKVDLRPNPTLDAVIQSYSNIGPRCGPGFCDNAIQYRTPSGTIYARESDHWDVLVP